MRRKIVLSTIICLIILVIILINIPLRHALRSYLIMYPYTIFEKNNSLLKQSNIKLNIPGGIKTAKEDWYPFVLFHNDNNGFSNYVGRKLSLTVLYNFGHFDNLKGMSSFFNPSSDYYSAFYGGYIIKDHNNKKFGFYENGKINVEEASKVAEYDYKYLVLESLGCPKDKMVFNPEINEVEEDVSYIGYDGWTQIDSVITTNGSIHKHSKKQKAYIQYGVPREEYFIDEEFPKTTLQGRTYIKYFKEKDVTIFLYIMAPTKNVIENCDEEILAETKLSL